MKKIFKGISRYVSIYLLFARNSIAAQMEYRINFIIALFVESAYLGAKLLYVLVVYGTGTSINGMSPDSILLFIGTYTIMTGIMNALFFPNIPRISGYVRDGSLDFLVTKPISLQFITTLRFFDLGLAIPNIAGGGIMALIACNRLGIAFSFPNIAGYLLLISASTVITYVVLLFPALLTFWIVKSQALDDITFALWDFNNMPMGIYNKYIQWAGIYILPIFIISNFPSMFLLGQLHGMYMLWAVIAPIFFLALIRLFWNFSVRNYSSASS